jgi:hypothetical protein
MATARISSKRINPHRLPRPVGGYRKWMSVVLTGIVFTGLSANGAKAQASEACAKTLDVLAKSFFAPHCQACHTGQEPKGEFRLESLANDFSDKANRERGLAVLGQLKSGAMPPKEKPRPPARDVEALTEWIGRQATAAIAAQTAEDGRVVLRRLNRAEYQNTVRDLLAVDVDLKDLLPEDTTTSGFDNSAEALHVSSFLMASYLEAADHVLELAIANKPRPDVINRRFSIKDEQTVKATGSVYRHVDDGVAIFSSWVSANIQVTLWQFGSRERGKYRFRISAYGLQTDKPVTFHVLVGPLNAAAQQELVDYFTVAPGEPKVVEFVRLLEPQQTIRIVADGLGVTPPVVEKAGADKYEGPGLVVQWVDIEGPLLESWPPPSHRRIFGDLPQERVSATDDSRRLEVVSQQPLVDAERILKDFTRRAFRRSVTDADIKPFLARVQTKLEQGDSFEQALRVGLKSVLISPHFLFLREKRAEKGQAQLDDFSLASRLSYFLWSSMPDDELLALAEQGKLHEPETLRQQVERLLRDPKAAAFTENLPANGGSAGHRRDDARPCSIPSVTMSSGVDGQEVMLFFDESTAKRPA